MNKLTIEQLDEFLFNNKSNEKISISLGDLTAISVKTFLTEAERKIFVSRVVENAYSGVEYSPIDRRIAYVATFVQMFTDLPVLTKDDGNTIDVDKMCYVVEELNIIENSRNACKAIDNILTELEMCIEQEIDLKNRKLIALYSTSSATNEAIENFSFAMNKVVELCDTAINQLEKNGNKLFKSLTPKKIDAFINKIQGSLLGVLAQRDAVNDNNVTNIMEVKLNPKTRKSVKVD